jgi:MICOS complex subunit MIC26
MQLTYIQHILPLAGLTAALTLYPKRSAFAEEPPTDPVKQIVRQLPLNSTYEVSKDLLQRRKPIYDPPQPLPSAHEISSTTPPPASGITDSPPESGLTTPRGPSPTDRLAAQIKKSRLFLHRYAVAAEDGVNSGMDSFLSAEHSFTSTIASLAPPKESNEKLLPGGIYVLVAAMAGSIISRNRNILIRFATPIVTGVTAAHYVVPRTTRNAGDLIWSYEEKFPVVRDNHIRIKERDALCADRQSTFANGAGNGGGACTKREGGC